MMDFMPDEQLSYIRITVPRSRQTSNLNAFGKTRSTLATHQFNKELKQQQKQEKASS